MAKVYAVGIGPGSLELLTPQACRILSECTAVAGYRMYLDQIAPLIEGKKLIPGAMRQELQRCRQALDAVLNGETVAVVSSGDAGIYGMAGLLLELTEEDPYREIEVEVIPGITAATSCAALVGAPLMNDFAVVSLSDLMTDRETIEKRLRALAAADLPTVLYNPASRRRHELLDYAIRTFREAGGNLPCALVRDAYRDGEQIEICRLDDFPFEKVQMTTLVLIGNSQTRIKGNRLYNRRGYRDKYGLES